MFENKLKILQGEMSLGEFAKRLETPKTTLYQYLNGRPFPFEFAVLVCERFRCSLDWLAAENNHVSELHHPYASDSPTKEELEILRRFKRLDKKHQHNILEMMAGYEALSEGHGAAGSAGSGSEAKNYRRRSTD